MYYLSSTVALIILACFMYDLLKPKDKKPQGDDAMQSQPSCNIELQQKARRLFCTSI